MRILPLLALCACAPATHDSPLAPVTAAPGPFTIAVFPDVQYYTLSFPYILDEMVGWVAEQKEARNIAFLLQEGDLTHNNTDDEWQNANTAFSSLDGEIPYAVCVGNHDMASNGNHDTAQFNRWFGPDRWSDHPTFGSSRLEAVADDHFHTFHAGGVDWLVLSLIYDPPADSLAWAESVVVDHPHHRVIVLTHAYLAPDASRAVEGRGIWKQVVKPHTNVTMVINGHFIDGVAARQLRTRDDGTQVAEIFANYQQLELGGGGRMRLMQIDTEAGTIQVETCTAWDLCYDDPDNAFTFEGLDLSRP